MELKLNEENYRGGFLVDEEYLAGVSEEDSGNFLAYIIDVAQSEYVLSQNYSDLQSALFTINAFSRPWHYERISQGKGGCGSGKCGGGQCKGNGYSGGCGNNGCGCK